MTRNVTVKETIEKNVEYNYCDECGKLIDVQEELENGYIPDSSGRVQFGIYLYNALNFQREVDVCLCNECKEKRFKEFREGLNKLIDKLCSNSIK